MDKSLEILKSMSPEELNTLRMTIESILFPESKPFSFDQEARDVRRGKSVPGNFLTVFIVEATPFVGTEPTNIIGGTCALAARRLLPISPRPALHTSKSVISSASISSA